MAVLKYKDPVTGEWKVFSCGVTGAQGPKGDKGDTGAAGKDGATATQVIAALTKEVWTFTLSDGTTVTKEVPML